jgi:hypothetical protein
MNRIQALEQDVRRSATRLGRNRRGVRPAPPSQPNGTAPATKTPAPAAPTTTAPLGAPADPAAAPITSTQASVASAMSLWRGSAPAGRARQMSVPKRLRARAMSTLDYRVPDLPMPLQQTDTNVCWAFVATLMASWRDRKSWMVQSYIAGLGEPWASKFAANQGLAANEAPLLLATMGIQVESTQANFTSERWESMLREWGPLWVTADYDGNPGGSKHAFMLVGIHGPSDGDPTVDVIDTVLGREVQMQMSAFVQRYEQLAGTQFAGLQIRHWPAGAQQAAQLSLTWAQQAERRSRAFDGGAGALVAATGLLYQVVKDATTTNGLTWRKSELRGKMIPGNSESKKALADGTYQQKSFKAHRTIQWDYPVIGTDNVGADFEVTYEYNGSCVANVRMTNTSYAPGAPLSGHELTVDTNITQSFAAERNDVVAVEIEIVWQFNYARGSAGTYTHRYTVFGDGRAEVVNVSQA